MTMDAIGGPQWGQALALLRAATGAPMVFGGPVLDGRLRLTYFLGERTGALDGLEVRFGAGLGGKVWAGGRIESVDEYGLATTITHDYDGPVSREGLRAVVAAPVLRGKQVRGVVYAGLRDASSAGDRLREVAVGVSARLGRSLAVEDEVARRLEAERSENARLREQVRELRAGLTVMRVHVADPAARREVERLLESADEPDLRSSVVAMTPRQMDVLTLVAAGLRYAAIGDRLGLSAQTVKSYMRDINRKLGADSRHEAVVVARRAGLLV